MILAIDTSHAVGSATLAGRGRVPATEFFGAGGSHLVDLGPCVDRMLRDAGADLSSVRRLALVIGPGSFTGLRIGCAFAKGLFVSRALEVCIIDTLSLLMLPHLRRNRVCAMIDARKGEVYAAITEGTGELATEVLAPCVLGVRRLLETECAGVDVFVGTGTLDNAELIRAHSPDALILGEHDALPSTVHLATVAPDLSVLTAGEVAALEPKYIRASDAQMKRLKRIESE